MPKSVNCERVFANALCIAGVPFINVSMIVALGVKYLYTNSTTVTVIVTLLDDDHRIAMSIEVLQLQ